MTRGSNRPDWVETLKGYYRSGSSSFFILHGNVEDVVGSLVGEEYTVETLIDYLGRHLLGEYDLVLHYDMGRGLRIHPVGDAGREARMRELLGRLWTGVSRLPHEPTPMLRLLDKLVTTLLHENADGQGPKSAFLFDYGQLLCPPGDRYPEHLATFLNWARNPAIKGVNMIFALMTGSLNLVHPALIRSGHTTEIEVPMPRVGDRWNLAVHGFGYDDGEASKLADLSAGLTLSNLDNLLRMSGGKPRSTRPPRPLKIDTDFSGTTTFQVRVIGETTQIVNDEEEVAIETPVVVGGGRAEGKPFTDQERLSKIKKQLIEAQVPGLLEFVEPRLNLDLVAGHTAARRRLAEDAGLILSGHADAVPMGYLICGPVGVGKTFMAMCYAGTVGIPCVVLKNFRSKYVGETEANIERILGVLRELGPVAVIIDEADAAVGDRSSSGDAGTSSRVFAQLAGQMGNTAYRGKTVWFLLTCRPDLLPIDLKRQGRCEEHIPLFYPETPQEIQEMFQVMARKSGLELPREALPDLAPDQSLSGADIEALLTRVRRDAILADRPVDRAMMANALKHFRSSRGPEHELQLLAAILECSDLRYLPPGVRSLVDKEGGFDGLAQKFQGLKATLEYFK